MARVVIYGEEITADTTIAVKHITGVGTVIESYYLPDYEASDETLEFELAPGEMITIENEG